MSAHRRLDERSTIARAAYNAAGWALVGVGAAGALLPVLPSTIFLILAAACFARSSPRFETWLMTHPRFGPPVKAWRENGAIDMRAKMLAIAMMTASFIILVLTKALTPVALTVVGLVLLSVATFVATRPNR